VVSDTFFVSALVAVSDGLEVAAGFEEVVDVTDAALSVEHPPNIKAPMIKNVAKNCENLNRIASD
jgi:hypothetical protein